MTQPSDQLLGRLQSMEVNVGAIEDRPRLESPDSEDKALENRHVSATSNNSVIAETSSPDEGKKSEERIAELNLQIERERHETERERRISAEIEDRREARRSKDEARRSKREDREEREAIRARRWEQKEEARARRRENGRAIKNALIALPGVGKVAILGVVVVLVAGVLFGVGGAVDAATPVEVMTSSQLEKMVNISELSTARVVYNGVAEKKDEDGNTICHVYYEAEIDVAINLSDIEFEVDEESKIVYPKLPKLEVGEPVVKSSSVEFFENNPDISLQEVNSICEKDAYDEVSGTEQIFTTAEENLRQTVEALTGPLVEKKGYRIVWEKPGATEGGVEANASKNS